jgi:hypothetical protein
MAAYSVWRSGEALARLGPRLSGASREKAEDFAIRQSAADPDRKTWCVSSEETLRAVAEYQHGRLRLDRPHDRRALRLAREKGEAEAAKRPDMSQASEPGKAAPDSHDWDGIPETEASP